ncbi:putative disease resistance protein RGA3 [Hordeum vulgare]|nr:putative disease resistance protein RGA3 [Hordeum vulgare]
MVKLGRTETWCQIHTVPDMVLKRDKFIKAMAAQIGEVLELQIVLPNGFVGEFVRARVRLDVNKKFTLFVSFTKAGQTDFYQVKFEKIPVFCYNCGLLGHSHEECGTGEHDTNNLEWGLFILSPRRGRGGRGRGQEHGPGRASDRDRNPSDEPTNTFGRGRGAGRTASRHNNWRDNGLYRSEEEDPDIREQNHHLMTQS